jgi:hypothetical protein
MTEAATPDLSEFYKYSRPKRPPCRVGHALTQLKPADRKAAEAALDQDKNLITAAAIVTWFEKRGIKDFNTSAALLGHRKHTCTCFD